MRLPTHLLAGALLRRVNDAGGMAMVRASGDADTGTLLVLLGQGDAMRAVERVRDLDGRDSLIAAGPSGGGERALEDYWRRRRENDPDLWVIELDIAGAERLVAETIAAN